MKEFLCAKLIWSEMEEVELKFRIEAAIIKLGLEKEPRIVKHYGQLMEKKSER